MNAQPSAVTTGPVAEFVTGPVQTTSQATVAQAVTGVEQAISNPSIASAEAAYNDLQPILSSSTANVLKAELPPLISESKAGYKTTEFWVLVVTTFGDVITSLPWHTKLLATAASVAYKISRGLAKSGSPNVIPAPVD